MAVTTGVHLAAALLANSVEPLVTATPRLRTIMNRHTWHVLLVDAPVGLLMARNVAEPASVAKVIGRRLVAPHRVWDPLESPASLALVAKGELGA